MSRGVGIQDYKFNTPVVVKVRRLQENIRENNGTYRGKEGPRRSLREGQDRTEGRMNAKLRWPTLGSFKSLRSGLGGPMGKGGSTTGPLCSSSHSVKGQGLQTRLRQGNPWELGAREQNPWTFLNGSPEQNLLTEAKVTTFREGHSHIGKRQGLTLQVV